MSMKTSNFHRKIKYNDGRTKQSFKDETDINKILQRAQKAGTLSHLEKYQGSYGDFADFDFFESSLQLAKGGEIFDALPSELRSEFHQSPAEFFDYVNDPKNLDDLRKKLPGLAAPGRQNIDVSGKTAPDDKPEATPAAAEATPAAAEATPAAAEATAAPETPPATP